MRHHRNRSRRNPGDEGIRSLERAWSTDGSVESARNYLSALRRTSAISRRMIDRLDALWDVDWARPPHGLVELLWLVSTGHMETDPNTSYRSRVGAVVVPGNWPGTDTLFHASVGLSPVCQQCERNASGSPDCADLHTCTAWGEFGDKPLVHLGIRSPARRPIPGGPVGEPYQTTQNSVSGSSSTTYAVPQEIALLWSRANGGGTVRQNPDEQQRQLERAAAAGDVDAKARQLVGLIRRGEIRADHVQSLAALGDPVAKLAVGKPKSTEGSIRLIFTDVDLVHGWGPVWAVIAATSFMEVLSPELVENQQSAYFSSITPGVTGILRELIWHGQAWVNCYGTSGACRRNCNQREHSSSPINTCFYDHAEEEVVDAIERAWGIEGWTLHAQSAAAHYMVLVDSADSAARGEPPRLYRSRLYRPHASTHASTPDTFGYDLWPVWSNVANSLSLRASSSTHGHNYDQALRQRAIDNLRPWILAGSPEQWSMWPNTRGHR